MSFLQILTYLCLFSQELPKSDFSVELDAASATWLSKDVVLLSTKAGELLLLTLVYDGRSVLLCTLTFSICFLHLRSMFKVLLTS